MVNDDGIRFVRTLKLETLFKVEVDCFIYVFKFYMEVFDNQ